MERVKKLNEILKPDPRNEAFVKIHRRSGKFRPLGIADYHRSLSAIALNERVPEDVRSYFETVKNTCLYGWFVYPFFTVSVFLSYTAIEMALRKTFEVDDPKRKWRFKQLLERAIEGRLISEDGFPSVRERKERQNDFSSEAAKKLGLPIQPSNDYCSVLVDCLPDLRNSFAHPALNTILSPGDAVWSLRIAAELINQLFQAPSGPIGPGEAC